MAYLDVREGGGRELVRVIAGVLGLRVRLVDEVLDLVVDVDRSHGSSGRDWKGRLKCCTLQSDNSRPMQQTMLFWISSWRGSSGERSEDGAVIHRAEFL